MKRIENTILSKLFYDETFLRKVIPFLKGEYFSVAEERILFNKIHNYIEKYNSTPSKEAILIAIQDDKSITEEQYKLINNIVDEFVNEDVDPSVVIGKLRDENLNLREEIGFLKVCVHCIFVLLSYSENLNSLKFCYNHEQ